MKEVRHPRDKIFTNGYFSKVIDDELTKKFDAAGLRFQNVISLHHNVKGAMIAFYDGATGDMVWRFYEPGETVPRIVLDDDDGPAICDFTQMNRYEQVKGKADPHAFLNGNLPADFYEVTGMIAPDASTRPTVQVVNSKPKPATKAPVVLNEDEDDEEI